MAALVLPHDFQPGSNCKMKHRYEWILEENAIQIVITCLASNRPCLLIRAQKEPENVGIDLISRADFLWRLRPFPVRNWLNVRANKPTTEPAGAYFCPSGPLTF